MGINIILELISTFETCHEHESCVIPNMEKGSGPWNYFLFSFLELFTSLMQKSNSLSGIALALLYSLMFLF